MEQWQRDAIDRLRKTGYWDVFTGMARRMCEPFWWSATERGNPPTIRGNGTICLIATDARTFGVTADHVYHQYLKDLGELPDVECQIGEHTIKPEYREIARDPALDLATFDIPAIALGPDAFFHHPLRWPPEPLKTGEVALHGGYPQALRDPRTGTVNFGFQFFITRVNDANEERIALEPGAERVYWLGHDGEQINLRWGGQSGGPVYRIVDASPTTGELLDRLELVGFVYNRVADDIVLARPAAYVRADGTLLRRSGLGRG